MNLDEAFEIYEALIDYLTHRGWHGKKYGSKEIVQSEPATGEEWAHFELINGFNLKLTCEMNGEEENVTLQYWFSDDSKNRIDVTSLEQVLDLAS